MNDKGPADDAPATVQVDDVVIKDVLILSRIKSEVAQVPDVSLLILWAAVVLSRGVVVLASRRAIPIRDCILMDVERIRFVIDKLTSRPRNHKRSLEVSWLEK